MACILGEQLAVRCTGWMQNGERLTAEATARHTRPFMEPFRCIAASVPRQAKL
jgi:hypothetical protein